LILVIAVGLYNLVERSSVTPPQMLNLTDLMNRVERGEVAQITVKGSDLKGRLTANNEPFRATIPDDYPAIFDRFTQAGIRVTVEPPDRSAWRFRGRVAGIPHPCGLNSVGCHQRCRSRAGH
jgi:cell division protease FtsH